MLGSGYQDWGMHLIGQVSRWWGGRATARKIIQPQDRLKTGRPGRCVAGAPALVRDAQGLEGRRETSGRKQCRPDD